MTKQVKLIVKEQLKTVPIIGDEITNKDGSIDVVTKNKVTGEHKTINIPRNNLICVEYTDSFIIDESERRHRMLKKAVESIFQGTSTSLIITGPPGVGKTHVVKEVGDQYQMLNKLGNATQFNHIEGGHLTKRGVFDALEDFSSPNDVTVFDDTDMILQDINQINLLKSATDSYSNRKLTWRTYKGDLSYTYRGRLIFISNLDFNAFSPKLQPHINALKSRATFIELPLWSTRAKVLFLVHMIKNMGLLRKPRVVVEDEGQNAVITIPALTEDQEEAVIKYMKKNQELLRSVDIRMAQRLQEFIYSYGDDWRDMADIALIDNKMRF